MWAFLGKRLVQMLVTLVLFQVLTFALLEAQPIDVADLLTGNPQIPPAQRDILRQQLGLDRPPVERFLTYTANFYKGEWGVSFVQYPRPVIDIIAEKLPRTLVLFFTATIASFWAGFVGGKHLAWKRGGFVEYGTTITSVVLYTVFTPWFALMMIWLFAVTLDWFPTGKFLDPLKWIGADLTANTVFLRLIWMTLIASLVALAGYILSLRVENRARDVVKAGSLLAALAGLFGYWYFSGLGEFAWDIVSHMFLPVLTVALISFGGTMLLMRTSMLETLREDYILTARAKGLSSKKIRDKHAARNALLPVWTSLVFAIGGAVGGGIITELIFSWPGIGLLLLSASIANDYPVLMGTLTIIGVMVLISHLVVDIGYAFLDPRIRVH